MKLCNKSKGYASPANAQKSLEKALAHQGLGLGDVRWLVAVNDEGRYAPVIVHRTGDMHLNLCALANAGVSIVNLNLGGHHHDDTGKIHRYAEDGT